MSPRALSATPLSTIVIAATLAIAKRRADALGIDRGAMLWPRSATDLRGRGALALYVDVSLWDHPRAEELADYVSWRWQRAQPRQTMLPTSQPAPSKVLN